MSEYKTPIMGDIDHMMGKMAFFGLIGAFGGWLCDKNHQKKQQIAIQQENRRLQIEHEKETKRFFEFALGDDMEDFCATYDFHKQDPKYLSKLFADCWNNLHSDILIIDYRNGFNTNLKICFDKWKAFDIS